MLCSVVQSDDERGGLKLIKIMHQWNNRKRRTGGQEVPISPGASMLQSNKAPVCGSGFNWEGGP